jgi:hypothetical protein
LVHLRGAGIETVPEPLGLDEDGRAAHRWIDGTAGTFPVQPWAATDTALAGLAGLIRTIHDASTGFHATPNTWDELLADPTGSTEVVCQNDLSLPNTIFRQGQPIAIIDWEFAAPGSRLWDLAYAAWWCVPLHRPECAAALGWPPDIDNVKRLRAFGDAYGLSIGDYPELFDVLHNRQLANQRQLHMWVEQGVIAPYDDTDPTIEVGLTDYLDARRDDFLAALRD